MGLEYIKKGRVLGKGKSPSTLQRRQPTSVDNVHTTLIQDLLEKVSSMTVELDRLQREGGNAPLATVVSNTKSYSEEEFNDELTKAISKELDILNLKLEVKDDKIHALQLSIDTLEKANALSDKSIKIADHDVVSKRPEIDNAVIDPTEDSSLESHIDIKEVAYQENDMDNKVSKLKELLGSD